jgi:hypothetical protein
MTSNNAKIKRLWNSPAMTPPALRQLEGMRRDLLTPVSADVIQLAPQDHEPLAEAA